MTDDADAQLSRETPARFAAFDSRCLGEWSLNSGLSTASHQLHHSDGGKLNDYTAHRNRGSRRTQRKQQKAPRGRVHISLGVNGDHVLEHFLQSEG
jgi:hypothetical protein